MIDKIIDGVSVAMADAAMQKGNYRKACSMYQKLAEKNKDYINMSSVLYSISYCYYKLGDNVNSLSFLTKCLKELSGVNTTVSPYDETFKDAQRLNELLKTKQ